MRCWLLRALLLLTLLPASHASAVEPDEILTDPVLESRARALSKELRCMVCQNQSIDDSDAPLARDLRILVRERLKSGDSDRAVVDFLVARYGEFVLLRPRFSGRTALLWLGPGLVLIIGVLGLFAMARRNRARLADSAASTAALTEAEEARLADILNRDQGR
jgi:cytochrome c-type biogenesis protein CcmH